MEATDPTLQKLLLYTVDQVQEQGGTVTLTKLTKLLYLIDVEHYRQYGKLLTPLHWVFYRYGPWAFALPRALKQAHIDLGEEEFVTPRAPLCPRSSSWWTICLHYPFARAAPGSATILVTTS